MKQILHIFRKDVLHFWPEIVGSLAITAAYAVLYPNIWVSDEMVRGLGANHSLAVMRMVSEVLIGAVPVSWWILITRVVHAETMVGDRQYWLTRPYEWKKLLAAKGLYLVVFLYLPFSIALCMILVEGGFQPLQHLPALMFSLVLDTGILILPLFALATVTKNFARMTLALLCVLASVGGIAYLDALVDSSTAPFDDRVSIPLIFCFGYAAIAQQYAARKVWLSRLLLILLLVMIMTNVLFIMPSGFLMRQAYVTPAGMGDQPIYFKQNQDQMNKIKVFPGDKPSEVSVYVPVEAYGVVNGQAVFMDAVKASVDTPGRKRWESRWRSIYGRDFLPGGWQSTVSFEISRAEYEKLKSAPVTLHLDFALSVLRAGEEERVQVPLHSFSVPNFGICMPVSLDGQIIDSISCKTALSQPREMYVRKQWSRTDCVPEGEMKDERGTWEGDIDPDPADFGITSVWQSSLNMVEPVENGAHLCKGATLSFVPYTRMKKTMYHFTIPNVQLPNESSLEEMWRTIK